MQETSRIFIRSLKLRLLVLGGVIVVTVAILGGVGHLIKKETAIIQGARAERQSVIANLNTLSSVFSQHDRAREIYAQLAEALEDEFRVVVSVPREVRELGAAHELRIQVDIGNKINALNDAPAGIVLQVRADGSMANIVRFIEALETSPRFFRVRTMGVTPLGATGSMQLNAEVTVYIDE